MTWTIDPVHSSLQFAVKHMVVATTKGTFAKYTADANINLDDLTRSSALIQIDAESVDTRNSDRDTHLRSADFFDTTAYPTITFQSRRIESKGGSDYRIVGDLTIKGVTREVELDGEINGPVKDPWGNMRVGLSGQAKISRKDWGLTYNGVLEAGGVVISDQVRLEVDAEFVKAA